MNILDMCRQKQPGSQFGMGEMAEGTWDWVVMLVHGCGANGDVGRVFQGSA